MTTSAAARTVDRDSGPRAAPAGVYIATAFALSWLVWVPALLIRPDAGQWVAMVGAFGPAVAAALMVRRSGGSVRRWLADIAVFAAPLRWYVIAAGIPVLFVATQGVAAALIGVPLALGELPIRFVNFLLTGAVVVFVGGGQEEPGWRGWLQPALQARMSPLVASVVVGAVWAFWHVPLFAFDFHFYGDLRFALYAPTLVGLAVIATFLWNRTRGSVVVVMVFHAAVNASGGLLPVDESQPAAADLTLAGQAVLTVAVLAAAAGIAVRHGVDLGGAPPAPHGVHGSSRTRPTRRGRLTRLAVRALVVVAVLALLGSIAQGVGERRDAAAHPAPGELVELPDGRMLHLIVAGAQHEGPTVILEGGAGASVAGWGWVLPAVAEHATVVAYDRAGLGWSDPSRNGRSAEAVITDLRDALASRGLPGPYIVAGHSLGSHYVRAFAAAYPDEVAGLVLIDPSHEEQAAAVGMNSEAARPMFTALSLAARLGVMRLLPPMGAEEIRLLPHPQRQQALTQMKTTSYWRVFGEEMAAIDEIGARLPGAGALGDRPVRVLIATDGATNVDAQRMIDVMTPLREGLTSLSSQAESTILPDASHVSIVTDRVQAEIVAAQIVEVVEAARQP